MSIFEKGDFKIENSWGYKPSSKGSRKSAQRKSGEKERPLLNAGQKILEPSPNILDERVMNQVLKEFEAEIPPPPASIKSEKKISGKQSSQSNRKYPPRQKTKTNQDGDLLSSMASRLKNVEMTCQSQKNELKQKNVLIEKLKAENMFLKGMRENSQETYSKFAQLENKNKELEEKAKAMEEYLKNYGLKWVGKKIQGDLNHKQMKKDISDSKNNYRLPSEIDIGTIKRRVQQLNGGLHAEGHGTQIYVEKGIHKFRKAEPLPMAFYGNGIAIKGYNFQPYKSKQSLRILSDLVDGYFPYILKQRYPNGVFLDVIDRIETKFNLQEQQNNHIASLDELAKNDFKPPSKDQFLQKLPKNVIKNGKVIPIRSQIEKKLQGKEQKIEEDPRFWEQNDGIVVFKTECHKQVEKQELSSEDICTLKIRTDTGKICILKLKKAEGIVEVYRWMKKMVRNKFKIVGNFPPKTYQENQQGDLEVLGLFPNAALQIQLLN